MVGVSRGIPAERRRPRDTRAVKHKQHINCDRRREGRMGRLRPGFRLTGPRRPETRSRPAALRVCVYVRSCGSSVPLTRKNICGVKIYTGGLHGAARYETLITAAFSSLLHKVL